MHRRRFLGVASGLGAILGGCLTNSPLGARTATVTRQTPYAGPVRCRGDPVALQKTYPDPAGYDDDIEYFPDNRTVRYVAATSGGEPVHFATQSFEAWASRECASVGAQRVRTATTSRLGTDAFSAGVGAPTGTSDATDRADLVIRLQVVTRTRDDGSVSTPPVPLARLANVAPRTANVTITIEGDSISRAVPVVASHTESAPA